MTPLDILRQAEDAYLVATGWTYAGLSKFDEYDTEPMWKAPTNEHFQGGNYNRSYALSLQRAYDVAKGENAN
jgi:hypothetical protein